MKYFRLIFSMYLLLICVNVLASQQIVCQDLPQNGYYEKKYANGKVSEKGYYKNGLKHRTWDFYNEYGLRIKSEKWKAGVLMWQVFYNARGRTIKIIDKNGVVKELSGCGC